MQPQTITFINLALLLGLANPIFADQVYNTTSNIPISNRDRVYTADQTSNTISVINPANNTLVGRISLGNSRPNVLSALYRGELNVHGLGFSPDHRTLAVISTGSNAVTLIDTATNTIKGTVYIGRSPHEGFFTPNGRELWVAVRGEDYISVIDPEAMREVRQIKVAKGQGMVMFSPDGKLAYICSSFTAELDVIDTRSYQVTKRIPVVSPFSPNIAITPDGSRVWLTHKDVGKVSVVDTESMTVKAILETGAITNHVNFANNRLGNFAYVTVGGLNQVKVYRLGQMPELVATIAVGELPHGLWASGDGTRMYVGLENGDAVDVIDTLTQKRIGRVPVGYAPQALVYVPNAVTTGEGKENLQPPTQMPTLNIELTSPKGDRAVGHVTIRQLAEVDGLEVMVRGLMPDQEYGLYLVGDSPPQLITVWSTDKKGNGMGQALGSLRERLRNRSTKQHLVIAAKNAHNPVNAAILIQSDSHH
ncbi:MAG: beta-propeller fold lactonase family protein [Chamaesiphon sp.]